MRERSLSGNHVDLCASSDGWSDLEKESRKKDRGKAFNIVLVLSPTGWRVAEVAINLNFSIHSSGIQRSIIYWFSSLRHQP